MNLPRGARLVYVVFHEAWYRQPGQLPHITVKAGTKREGVGFAWEFRVEEKDFGDGPRSRVLIFQDAFAAFAHVPEFFAALADGRGKTLADVRAILDQLGAVDETQRIQPRS